MKKIFVMAALSLAAISCTKSDVLDSPVLNQEISFTTYLGKAPVTKAFIQDTGTVKKTDYSFSVKAIKYYKGADNKYDTLKGVSPVYMSRKLFYTGSVWRYDSTLVYWPTDGAALRFVAFGNNVNPTTTTTSTPEGGGEPTTTTTTTTNFELKSGSHTEYTYTVPASLTDQQDLIVATTEVLGTDPNADKTAVTLNFYHLLTRIGFSLISNADIDVHISELKLVGNFKTKASIDLLSETNSAELELTPIEGNEQDVYTVINENNKQTFTPQFKKDKDDDGKELETNSPVNVPILGTDATVANRYLMIIPQTGANADGKCEIIGTYTIGDDKTPRPIKIDLTSLPALCEQQLGADDNTQSVYKGFLAGKAYEFVLNVKTEVISFNVIVDEWDNVDDDFKQKI